MPATGGGALFASGCRRSMQSQKDLTEDACPHPPLLHILPQGDQKEKAEHPAPHKLLVEVTLYII